MITSAVFVSLVVICFAAALGVTQLVDRRHGLIAAFVALGTIYINYHVVEVWLNA